jgi:HAMP domain-containing protein
LAVVDTAVEEIGISKEDRDYFRQPRDTGLPYVSAVRVSPVTGNISLYFSAPVRNKVGDFLGVLRVRYDARILQQLVLNQSGSAARDALSMVVSDENILLVHSDDPQLISRAIMPLSEDQIAKLQQELALPATSENPYFVDLPELADYIAADNLGTGFSGVFQESRTYVLANREQANAVRMKTLPWTVVVAQQERVLLAPVAQMERGNMLTGIIAAVLSVIVGGAVARYLALPLIKLTDVARQVAAGDLSARATVTTHDEIGTLAGTFNQMAAQLNSLITGLEQRVADRTKALATSAEVSRRLSTILDQDLLVSEVVDQLQRAFSYYHVHIYLMDDSSTNLVLAGGTGEAGKEMLAKGHKIARGRGLVGRAAETGVPVLVPDVTRAQGWLPNPLLPESKLLWAIRCWACSMCSRIG